MSLPFYITCLTFSRILTSNILHYPKLSSIQPSHHTSPYHTAVESSSTAVEPKDDTISNSTTSTKREEDVNPHLTTRGLYYRMKYVDQTLRTHLGKFLEERVS